MTLGLSCQPECRRCKGNQVTVDNSQWNNLRSCLWVFSLSVRSVLSSLFFNVGEIYLLYTASVVTRFLWRESPTHTVPLGRGAASRGLWPHRHSPHSFIGPGRSDDKLTRCPHHINPSISEYRPIRGGLFIWLRGLGHHLRIVAFPAYFRRLALYYHYGHKN